MVALSTASLFFWPIRKVWEVASEAGFEGLEIFLNSEIKKNDSSQNFLSDVLRSKIISFHIPWAKGAIAPQHWNTLLKHTILCGLHVISSLKVGKRPLWPFTHWDEEEIMDFLRNWCQNFKGSFPIIIDDNGPFEFCTDTPYSYNDSNFSWPIKTYELCHGGRHTIEQAVENNLSVCFDTKHIREIPGMTLERAWERLGPQVREIHFQPTTEELSAILEGKRPQEVSHFFAYEFNKPEVPIVVEISPLSLHGLRFWDTQTVLTRLKKVREYLRDFDL